MKPKIDELLSKLNELYNQEDDIIKKIKKLYIEYEQLQEDKDMLQTMIMHTSNKIHRVKSFKDWQKENGVRK